MIFCDAKLKCCVVAERQCPTFNCSVRQKHFRYSALCDITKRIKSYLRTMTTPMYVRKCMNAIIQTIKGRTQRRDIFLDLNYRKLFRTYSFMLVMNWFCSNYPSALCCWDLWTIQSQQDILASSLAQLVLRNQCCNRWWCFPSIISFFFPLSLLSLSETYPNVLSFFLETIAERSTFTKETPTSLRWIKELNIVVMWSRHNLGLKNKLARTYENKAKPSQPAKFKDR